MSVSIPPAAPQSSGLRFSEKSAPKPYTKTPYFGAAEEKNIPEKTDSPKPTSVHQRNKLGKIIGAAFLSIVAVTTGAIGTIGLLKTRHPAACIDSAQEPSFIPVPSQHELPENTDIRCRLSKPRIKHLHPEVDYLAWDQENNRPVLATVSYIPLPKGGTHTIGVKTNPLQAEKLPSGVQINEQGDIILPDGRTLDGKTGEWIEKH